MHCMLYEIYHSKALIEILSADFWQEVNDEMLCLLSSHKWLNIITFEVNFHWMSTIHTLFFCGNTCLSPNSSKAKNSTNVLSKWGESLDNILISFHSCINETTLFNEIWAITKHVKILCEPIKKCELKITPKNAKLQFEVNKKYKLYML